MLRSTSVPSNDLQYSERLQPSRGNIYQSFYALVLHIQQYLVASNWLAFRYCKHALAF
jgi:hypothetical protein